jgi:opacity protein-like surface antigen
VKPAIASLFFLPTARLHWLVLVLVFGNLEAYGADSTTNPAPVANKSPLATDPKDSKQIAVVEEKPASPLTFRVGVPGWASAVSGSTGVRGFVSDAKYISFTGIVDHLDYVIPGSVEVGYGKWGVLLDGQYTKLHETLDTRGILFSSANVDMEQAFAELNISYKVIETDRFCLAPFVGTRFEYEGLHGQATSTGKILGTPTTLDDSGSKAWADPILGFQARYRVFKPCSLVGKADVGGFGAASHLTYQFFAGAETQLTKNLYVSGGYRYLQTDYTSGGFTYNIAFSGPQITFGVNF